MEASTQKPLSQGIDYASADRPLSQGVNYRLVMFLAVVAIPFIALAYGYISHQINGGIVQEKDYAKVDLKSLGFFQFDAMRGTVQDIPAKWRALDGKRVQLEGFMYAGSSAGPRLTNFQLVYNIQKCCFSGPPLVQERVFAKTPAGRSLPYVNDMVRVTGILHVNVKRVDGNVEAIYTLDIEHAQPVS